MMSPTQRHSEFVTDLAADGPVLRKAQVMGIARLATANQAGLLRDKPDMRAIANAPRFRMYQNRFVHRRGWRLGSCFALRVIRGR